MTTGETLQLSVIIGGWLTTLGSLVISVKYISERVRALEIRINNGISDKLNFLVTDNAVQNQKLLSINLSLTEILRGDHEIE